MKRADPTHLPFAPVAWSIAALLLASTPHMLAMPPVLGIVIVLACAWRLSAAWWRWRPPPGWLRLLLTLAAIAVLAVSYGGLWGRRAAAGMLCLMLAAKMLELYRFRDLRLVASVSLFLIATQFLFDERLVFTTYLLGGVLVSICAFQSIQAAELGHRPDTASQGRLIGHSAVLLATALPIALLLFLAFPRLSEPLWGLPDEVMDGKTGLSDSMSPGSIADLYIDDSPAFRAEFSGSPPAPSDRYWRGPVLWRFDGDTWERSFLPSRMSAAEVPASEDDFVYTVQLEPHERHWLFALDYPVNSPDQAHVSMDFQIVRRHPVTTLTEYRMRSNPGFEDMPQISETLRRLALSLPEDRNPRTREMAQSLRQRFVNDRALIDHVLDWLRQEPFFYSLDAAPLGRHSADEFLFDLREGYCEYYASAFAVLMRSAGIPARIVTGYQGGYWQEGGRYILVRQSDAHAWVEVWIEGSGWTRIDPTAAVSPERIRSGVGSVGGDARALDWLLQLRNRYDRLQHLWNSWVLGFDADRQTRMLRSVGLPGLTRTTGVFLAAALAALIVALLAWWWLRDRSARPDPVQRAWLKLTRRMRRRGQGPGLAETPAAWVDRVAPRLAEGDRLRELLADYCAVRYGDLDDERRVRRILRASRRISTQRTEPSRRARV